MFTIHKDLLCKKVEYFNIMFNGEFIESQTQAASFPEDHPIAFKLFVSWLYRETIAPLQTIDQCGMTECQQLCRLFALAEKYEVPLLADACMDAMISFSRSKNGIPNIATITLGYLETFDDSKLRIYLARCCAYIILTSGTETSDGTWSNEKLSALFEKTPVIMEDVMPLLRRQAGKMMQDPREVPACEYHQHAKTEPCPHNRESSGEQA